MDADITTFLIICPICFLTGLMNASGGSGGLLSLPALMFVGLPAHVAIGTNKLQAICGLIIANIRYIKDGFLNFKLAIPSIACAVIGSLIGSELSMRCSEQFLLYLMLLVLPIVAFIVFKKKSFLPNDELSDIVLTPRLYRAVCAIGFIIGIYDGFYGPGSGTFLVIALTSIAHLDIRHASAQARALNCSTNISATIVFLMNGYVNVALGLIGGACSMIGSWLGAGMVIKKGASFMKPLIIFAFVLLVIRVVSDLI